MIVLALSDATTARVADLAGRVGLTPSAFLSDLVEGAYGNGRAGLAPARQSRSARRRIAAAKRAACTARSISETTPAETHG